MKKIMISMALVLFACAGANAQQTPESSYEFVYNGAARPNFNEISASYGYMTMPFIGTLLGDILGSVIVAPMSSEKLDNVKSTGVIGLEYMRYLNSGRAAFGAMAGFERFTTVFVDKNDSSKKRTVYGNMVTVMPSVKVMWFNRKAFGMYTRAAAGAAATIEENHTRWSFAFQLSAVGMDFGGEYCRGFIEAGLGNQGIINAGIKANF